MLVPIFSLTMSMAISKVRSDVAADCECSVTIGRKVLMSPPRWSHSVPLFTCMASRQALHSRPVSRLALQHSSRDFLQEKIIFSKLCSSACRGIDETIDLHLRTRTQYHQMFCM